MNEKLKELDGRLFSNVGASIKKVTKIVFWIETALAVLAAIICFLGGLFSSPALLGGTISCLILPLFFWLGSLAMYGFGDLIDNVGRIAGEANNSSKSNPSKRLTEITTLYKNGLLTEEEYRLAIEKEN